MTAATIDQHSLAPIWEWYPQDLTPFSSLWWFFLLCPEEKAAGGRSAYGPRQIMLTLVSRVGETVTINGVTHDGLQPQDVTAPFPAYTIAWMHTGQQMFGHIANEAGTGQVTPGEGIRTWTPEGFGSEVRAGDSRPFAVTARFQGPGGGGEFEAWGDPASPITAPYWVHRNSRFGSADVVAWRRLQFAGRFTTPAGTDSLSGLGYFQRVCLDIMPFPWKWLWLLFADGSVLSCFIPFLGPHLLRRGDWFFNGFLENLALPLQQSAYFWDAGTGEQFSLKPRIGVRPGANGQLPRFAVSCEAGNGDYLLLEALPYAHHQVLLDRPLLRGRWQSRYNYNEYVVRSSSLTGRLNRRPLDMPRYGQGYGNMEYSWGLGL
jgi:hypothetical protein